MIFDLDSLNFVHLAIAVLIVGLIIYIIWSASVNEEVETTEPVVEKYMPILPQSQYFATWVGQGDMCINGSACNYNLPHYP